MNPTTLRAWWHHRQGLDGSMRKASSADVLARAGWARSVGGVGPYVSLFARNRASRETVDAAVAALDIHELPTARGCTYVLPVQDFVLGLAAGRTFGDGDLKTALKLGVTEAEVEKLCKAVLKALDKGPLDPDAIREKTGDASRSLGEAGKKKGLTTTLPLALGRLQTRGDIRRVPVNGRLDQQRYRYARWSPNPLATSALDEASAYTELARRFFAWVGPATAAELQWFSGLGVKAAKVAMEPLKLEPAEEGSDRLLLPGDVKKFRAFEAPTEASYALISSLDSITAARRDVETLLDMRDVDRVAQLAEGGRRGGALMDLPSHAIVDRGRIIGLWEFDPDAGRIVWATFGVKQNPKLLAAVDETETYVREQLGDARSFSLDSPKSRAPRIATLRAMG